MTTKIVLVFGLVVGSPLLGAGGVLAQDANITHRPMKTIGQATPTGPVPSLFVVNSAGAKLERQDSDHDRRGGKLDRLRRSPRPGGRTCHYRAIHHAVGRGQGQLTKDPPNGTISVLGGDGSKVEDAVVTLRSPKIDAGNLTFDVSVLEGSLSGSSGPAALFIDPGAYNDWHAPVYHGSWYAGARATNDPGLYYNPNSLDCASPRAQSEGFC